MQRNNFHYIFLNVKLLLTRYYLIIDTKYNSFTRLISYGFQPPSRQKSTRRICPAASFLPTTMTLLPLTGWRSPNILFPVIRRRNRARIVKRGSRRSRCSVFLWRRTTRIWQVTRRTGRGRRLGRRRNKSTAIERSATRRRRSSCCSNSVDRRSAQKGFQLSYASTAGSPIRTVLNGKFRGRQTPSCSSPTSGGRSWPPRILGSRTKISALGEFYHFVVHLSNFIHFITVLSVAKLF